MGHPPPNHYVGTVMAFCTLRTHLWGLLNINLIVLIVTLLLDGKNFLVCEEECPFEWWYALMCRLSLMRQDLIESKCSAFWT